MNENLPFPTDGGLYFFLHLLRSTVQIMYFLHLLHQTQQVRNILIFHLLPHLDYLHRILLIRDLHVFNLIISLLLSMGEKYDKVPKDFLKDIFLSPHNFSDPENVQHGKYVNLQLRQDLYGQVLNKIANVEFASTPDPEVELKVQKITECLNPDPWMAKFKDRKYITQQDDLIRCEQWQVKNSSTGAHSYRVKILQSKTDRFFSMVYPPTLRGYWQLYLDGLM